MSKVCDAVFIIQVSICQLGLLSLVLRDMKQITRGQEHFRCSGVEEVCEVNARFPPPWKVIMFISTLKVLLSLAIKQALESAPNLLSKENDTAMCVLQDGIQG